MSDAAVAALLEQAAIFEMIRTTAARLDDEDLDGWLALFAPESRYEIKTYGPEIRADMSWWSSDRDELEKILAEAKLHVRDPCKRLHLVTPISADLTGDRATARSHFAIMRTDPHGNSAVYAAGRYEDTFVKREGRWLYEKHIAALDTRKIEPFTHLPL
ncbi:MAG: nuclear transport factor 2 family protein [Rhodospirillaceae bacterium]|nr:nuclear transport factor 2 family protein [Rhodospirillaceae bacterium]